MKRIAWLLCLCWCASLGMLAQKTLQQEADSIVKYQLKSGGWPKNQNWLKGVSPKEAKEWKKSGIGSTIDNGATIQEMDILTRAMGQIRVMEEEDYLWMDRKLVQKRKVLFAEAFRKGVKYLLDMQYPSGGFPQYYPPKAKPDYSAEITFNDNAMVNALRMLRDVAGDSARYRSMQVDAETKKLCQAAYERGLQCIAFCQIRVNESGRVLDFGSATWRMGQLTVWCQQHDHEMFAPVGARSYELPSYCGFGETCGILDLLMDIPDPSPEVKEMVTGAVEWLKAHAMKDVALEHFTDESGRDDIRLVEKKGAPLLWARFYDLEKCEPMFVGRDGVPHASLSDIEYERRNGYQWVSDAPKKVIDRYQKWITNL